MLQSRRGFLQSSASLALAGAGLQIFTSRMRAANDDRFAPPNARIRRAREAGLARLQPTAAQLEHGLALHADALVFESYGFAPRGALDGDAFRRAVQAGAESVELTDLQEENTMTQPAISARERREFFAAFRAAGVTCIFQNAGEEGNDPARLIKRLAHFTFTTDRLRPELSRAVWAEDIVRAKAANQLCLCFSANGVPLPGQWQTPHLELRLISQFYQLGIRMMHLTYNRRNPLGDGAGEPQDGGVSDFGRLAIAEMNRVGVIVDVAHSGWRTSTQAARFSQRPMVASHTVCGGLNPHIRSKPDETIRAICDTGGYIGICAIPRFLGGKGDITAMLDHLDYAARKFGADHVAIGTDVAYVSQFDSEERKKVPSLANGKSPLAQADSRWEALWPAEHYATDPVAAESIAWTNWPLFTVGLVQRGHSDDDIRKIVGGNALRVLKANEGQGIPAGRQSIAMPLNVG